MRASPQLQVSLTRFGVWRSAVWALALAAAVALAAWLGARDEPPAAWAALGGVLCAVVWLASSLARVPAMDLRWDGQAWHLKRGRVAPAATVPGHIVVAMDLGLWMLLRFEPGTPVGRTRAVWLPVQRRGIEPQWHALRCAVYSPRAAPGDDAVPP